MMPIIVDRQMMRGVGNHCVFHLVGPEGWGRGGATSEKDLWANGSIPAIRQIPWQRGPGASGHRRTVVSVKNAVRDVWLQTRKLSGKHYGKSEAGQVRAGRVQLLADFSPVPAGRVSGHNKFCGWQFSLRPACVFGNQAAVASPGRFASGTSCNLPDFTS